MMQFHFMNQNPEFIQRELEDQSKFYYAQLLAGEGNSGKLVSEIKRKLMNR